MSQLLHHTELKTNPLSEEKIIKGGAVASSRVFLNYNMSVESIPLSFPKFSSSSSSSNSSSELTFCRTCESHGENHYHFLHGSSLSFVKSDSVLIGMLYFCNIERLI